MKKALVFLLGIVMSFSITACGNGDLIFDNGKTERTYSGSKVSEAGNDENEATEDPERMNGQGIFNEELSNEGAAPESDFEYKLVTNYGEHAAYITGYTGSETELVIPALIEGLPVKRVTIDEKTGVTKIVMPRSIISMEDWMLRCESVEEAVLPEGLLYIPESAFYGDSSLSTVNIPESVVDIGDKAFRNCKNLTTVDIPGNVIRIGDSAFENCEKLSTVNIPMSVQHIGVGAFSHCASLSSVTLPEGLQVLGSHAFEYCGLLSIEIPGNAIEYVYFYDVRPSAVFQYCKALSNVIIRDGLTEIVPHMFSESAITTIEIPASVKTIGEFAFSSCESLETLVLYNRDVEIESDAFISCPKLATVVVYAPDQAPSIFTPEEFEQWYLESHPGVKSIYGK